MKFCSWKRVLTTQALRYQVELQVVQQYQGIQGSSSAVSEAKLLRQPRKSVHQVEVEGQSVSSMLCVELRSHAWYQRTLLKDADLGPRGRQMGSPTAISVPAFDKKVNWPAADEQTCVVSQCISLAMYLSTCCP